MKGNVVCLRSSPLEEKQLLKHATHWHTKVDTQDSSKVDVLLQDVVDTELIPVYCPRPDRIGCLTSIEGLEPACTLIVQFCERLNRKSPFDGIEPLTRWVSADEWKDRVRRLAIFVEYAFERTAEKQYFDYRLIADWSGTDAPKRWLGISLTEDSLVAQNLLTRLRLFADALRAADLQDQIAVYLDGDRFVCEPQPPWQVESRMKDKGNNPLAIRIAPFENLDEIVHRARRMIRASESHQLVAVEVRVEVVLDLYHQMLPSLPAGYEGWKLELFGHPTEGTQDWFAGNLEARPAGRIPLGWGWQGDENTGFSYSVSIVETDDGPCIELGAEGASIEQLKTCTRYFKGLKFGPV